eukprot:6197009-Prymnesium_polylepis.1
MLGAASVVRSMVAKAGWRWRAAQKAVVGPGLACGEGEAEAAERGEEGGLLGGVCVGAEVLQRGLGRILQPPCLVRSRILSGRERSPATEHDPPVRIRREARVCVFTPSVSRNVLAYGGRWPMLSPEA